MRHKINASTLKAPKFSFYRSDGCGRDTYILYNNGGTIVPRKSMSLERGSDKHPKHRTKHGMIKPSNSNDWPKVSFYHPDGSGRDSYIKQNEGGFLYNASKGGAKYQCLKYMNNLCNYGKLPPCRPFEKTDYW